MSTAPDSPTQGLSAKSARGFAWVLLGQLLSEPVRVLITAILARVLMPSQFGLMGMATVATGLIAVVNDFGLTGAIIQKEEIRAKELHSVFWFNLMVGAVLSALGLGLALPVSAFFHQPAVAPILAVISLTFVISSLGQVQNALLRREMDLRTPATANLVGVVVGGTVAVVMALSGFGVWSLVANLMIGSFCFLLVVALKTRFVPRLRFRWHEARAYVLFGGTVTLSEFASFGAANVDNAAIGRVLGASSLGVYSLAYNLVTYPVRRIADTVYGVTLPALSRLQREDERYGRAFGAAMETSATLMLPVLVAAAVAGDRVIVGLYGPKWTAAIVPFRLLCVVGIAKAYGVLANSGLLSTGRVRRYLLWNLLALAGVGVGVLFGIRSGVNGVAAGVAASVVAVTLALVIDVWRLVGPPLGLLAAVLARGAIVGALSGGIALAVLAVPGLDAIPELVSAVIAVVAAYAGSWLLLRKAPGFDALRQAERMVLDLARRRSDSPTAV
jgi:PST family polysaccharide transporter